MEGNMMKEKIIRILYILLGAFIGMKATDMFLVHVKMNGFILRIIFVAFGILIARWVEKNKFPSELEKIVVLVIAIILYYPLAWIFQYIAAAIIFIILFVVEAFQFLFDIF